MREKKVISEKIMCMGLYYFYQKYSPLKVSYNGGVLKSDKVILSENSDFTLSELVSLYRSRRTLRELILSNLSYGSPKFLTLTYRNAEFSSVKAKYDFNKFIKRLKYNVNPALRYIAVMEEHNSSSTSTDRLHSYHFHVLIFDVPFVSAKVYAEIWRYGFIKINAVKNDHLRIVSYLSKYLSKSAQHKKGERRFLSSRNIRRPYEVDHQALPALEFVSARVYNRFTGGRVRLEIYKRYIKQ